MIKANTKIIVGGNVYQKGQTVAGLSQVDKEWMKKAGYITEVSEKKKNSGMEKAEENGDEL